jgi:hypothetical protein
MLCPLQCYYQASQGFRVEAPPDFYPAPASQNDGQLAGVSALRRHLDRNPLRLLILTGLLPSISGQVPRQGLQRHSSLLAELPLAQAARFTFHCQLVGLFTVSSPP